MLTDSAVHAARAMIALGSLPASGFRGAGALAQHTATRPPLSRASRLEPDP